MTVGLTLVLAALLDHLRWVPAIEKLAKSHAWLAVLLAAAFCAIEATVMIIALVWMLQRPIFSMISVSSATIATFLLLGWGYV